MKRALNSLLFFLVWTSIPAQTYVLRYDDFSNFTISDIDEYLLRVHDSLNVPLNIGVVPWSSFSRDSIDYEDLDRNKLKAWNADVHRPFIHGLTHTKRRENSEFVGGTYNDQRIEILESKLRLDSLFMEDIRCWSAPYNSYDHTSLLACQELGIEYVFCSSKHGPVINGLIYVPSTVGLMDFFKFPVKMKFGANDTIVIQFHDYNFGSSFGKEDYVLWLKDCLKEGVDFVEYSQVGVSSNRYEKMLADGRIKQFIPYIFLPKECFTYSCQDCLWIFLTKFFITAFILVGLLIYGVLRF